MASRAFTHQENRALRYVAESWLRSSINSWDVVSVETAGQLWLMLPEMSGQKALSTLLQVQQANRAAGSSAPAGADSVQQLLYLSACWMNAGAMQARGQSSWCSCSTPDRQPCDLAAEFCLKAVLQLALAQTSAAAQPGSHGAVEPRTFMLLLQRTLVLSLACLALPRTFMLLLPDSHVLRHTRPAALPDLLRSIPKAGTSLAARGALQMLLQGLTVPLVQLAEPATLQHWLQAALPAEDVAQQLPVVASRLAEACLLLASNQWVGAKEQRWQVVCQVAEQLSSPAAASIVACQRSWHSCWSSLAPAALAR